MNAAIMSFDPKKKAECNSPEKTMKHMRVLKSDSVKTVRKDKHKFHKASERACEAREKTHAEGLHFSAFHYFI